MKRATRDALVVIFVLLAIGLAVFGYFWFSGRLETGRRQNVTVLFSDVTGLRVGDPVEVQGLPKGRVSGLNLDGAQIRCRVALDRDVALTRDTRFAIRSVSYLGSDRYLMVTLGTGPGIRPGDVFEGTNEALDLEETFLRLDQLVREMDLDTLAGELRQAGDDLMADVEGQLDRFVGQMDRLAGNLAISSEELRDVSAAVDRLAGLLQPGSTAERLLSSGELYDEIRRTNGELQKLIADVKQNPKRYFKISIF